VPVTRVARLALGAALLAGLTACGLEVAPPAASPPPVAPTTTTEGLPELAMLYLVGDPALNPDTSITIAFAKEDGEALKQQFPFAPGELIGLQTGFLPGSYTVIANGAQCGDIDVVGGAETDATITLSDPCRVHVDAVHEDDTNHAFGAASMRLPAKWSGAEARLESLDDPPHRVPRGLRVSDDGLIFVPGLMPGRYRLTVLAGSPPVSTEFEIGPGEEKMLPVP
jgi:hypothetical protein